MAEVLCEVFNVLRRPLVCVHRKSLTCGGEVVPRLLGLQQRGRLDGIAHRQRSSDRAESEHWGIPWVARGNRRFYPLDILRNYKRSAVIPCQHGVCFFITDVSFRLRIKLQSASQSIRSVCHVD